MALRVSDYDSFSKILYLSQSKRSSKTFQHIPTILSVILDRYLKDRFRATARCDRLPLFTGRKSDIKLSPRQVNNLFLKWKKKAGIRNSLTIHSFRSSYASRLYSKTKDPLFVSYALGHSSFETTKKYITEDLLDFKAMLENTF